MNCNLFNYSPENFYQYKIVPCLEEVTQNAELDSAANTPNYKGVDKPIPINADNPETLQKLVYFSESSDYIKKLARINFFSNLYLLTTTVSSIAAAVLFITNPLSVIPVIVSITAVVFLGMGVWNRHLVNCEIREIKISHEERMKEISSYLCDYKERIKKVQDACSDRYRYCHWLTFYTNESEFKSKVIAAIKKAWEQQSFALEEPAVYKAIIDHLLARSNS